MTGEQRAKCLELLCKHMYLALIKAHPEARGEIIRGLMEDAKQSEEEGYADTARVIRGFLGEVRHGWED
jgi:hypothetical protein